MTKNGDVPRWLTWVLQQETDECIVWPFRVSSSGYGEMTRAKKHWLAHRWVCWQVHGEPFDGVDAAHRCGNRLCCNPRHLRWATRSENHADKLSHGKHVFGESHPDSILTADQARDVFTSSESGAEIARKYGVHPNTVYAIRKGRSWRSVNA